MAAMSQPIRVNLRRVGETTGKMAMLPHSLDEVLDLATKKLELTTKGATRIFADTGDEIDEDAFPLIQPNDVLYVSCGEEWAQPRPKPSAKKSSPEAQPLNGSAVATAPGASGVARTSAASSSSPLGTSCVTRSGSSGVA